MTIKNIFFFTLLFLLPACAKDDPKPEWKYGKDAINISFHAALDINTDAVHNTPHSLLIVIYQLKDINEFNRLAGYTDGLKKLLEAKVFDPSVMAMKKIFIEPGGARGLTLDRAEDARFVGIVAGYSHLIPERCRTVQNIEVETERHGLFKIWKNTKISLLGIKLFLRRDSIRVENNKKMITKKKSDES
jgi:type VI secretion system VasD/TssJ family lipoprotein